MEDMAPARSDLPTWTEEGLLAAVRGGEPAACETLVRKYCTPLLAVARRILRNDEDAREAVQDAFFAAFKKIGQFDGRAQLSTWLHRIALNAALMKLRSRQRRPEQSIEALLPHFGEDEHQIDPPALWNEEPAAALDRAHLRGLVRDAIDRLPELYRTVLLLRDIEELDTEETARLLQTNTTVVKTRLHRARQALRTLLDPHLRRDEP
jgi:RNA polymerase sigma-70 factor (ECF subfamily)